MGNLSQEGFEATFALTKAKTTVKCGQFYLVLKNFACGFRMASGVTKVASHDSWLVRKSKLLFAAYRVGSYYAYTLPC